MVNRLLRIASLFKRPVEIVHWIGRFGPQQQCAEPRALADADARQKRETSENVMKENDNQGLNFHPCDNDRVRCKVSARFRSSVKLTRM